jgi:S-adenosylmethionine:tRNA ribosyltransferase-isomerase
VLVTDFEYYLPPELIAQSPLPDRAASRMMHLDRATGTFTDNAFRDLPSLLRPDDLLVFNNTRVFPARLFGRRSGERAQAVSERNPAAKEFLAGRVEVLLTKQTALLEWQALVRPGRKIGIGERLSFGEGEQPELSAEVVARGEFGERTLRFELPDATKSSPEDFFSVVERLGHIPLPPYIDREDTPADRERYQTVFAKDRGSAAAPTAGLHFTPEILDQIRVRGIETAEVTLHVGLGTFQPVRNERVEDNKLHTERYVISAEAAEKINRAKNAGRRVVAIGTTTVRTLEYAARQDPSIQKNHAPPLSPAVGDRVGTTSVALTPSSGEADIFIYPDFQFCVVDALLTNFHLPQSTLLMLVCAFAGKEIVMSAYEHAVKEKYRFFSYGDCMFVE